MRWLDTVTIRGDGTQATAAQLCVPPINMFEPPLAHWQLYSSYSTQQTISVGSGRSHDFDSETFDQYCHDISVHVSIRAVNESSGRSPC